MSKEGDRASVFRTTKVRTKLKGDFSWMQRGSAVQPQEEAGIDEKPWMAEVRASRMSSSQEPEEAPIAPITPTKPVDQPILEKKPSSGYLIRGVFTKTESAASPTSTTNGYRTSGAPTRLAPAPKPTAASLSEPAEGQLSPEEQERRTAAAQKVLQTSSVRQRSYVQSAARKFESIEKEPDTSVNGSPSFVAQRVEVIEDEESEAPAATERPTSPSVSPASSPAPPPASTPAPLPDTTPAPLPDTTPAPPLAPVRASSPAPVPAVLSTPTPPLTPKRTPPSPVGPLPSWPPAEQETTSQTLVEISVVTVSTEEVAAVDEPVKQDDDPFQDAKPGCTKVYTPLPTLTPEKVPEPEAEVKGSPLQNLGLSEMMEADRATPLRSAAPPAAVVQESAVWESPSPGKTSSAGDTLTELSDTLISFGTSSTSLLDSKIDDVPEPASPVSKSVMQEPVPEISNSSVLTDDLLSLSVGPEKPVEPVPPSQGSWSQDLLGEPESRSGHVVNSLDLLADNVIPIDTGMHSPSTTVEEKKDFWEQKLTDIQSPSDSYTTRTTTISSTENLPDSWSSQVTTTTTVVTSSSTDPFDPYPIGTASPNSSADPTPPLPAHSINSSVALLSNTSPAEEELNAGRSESTSTNSSEALADDGTPTDADTHSLSTRRSWARTWETDTSADERRGAAPAGRGGDLQTVVTFERKSLENDSPWDRWTSPTVLTVPSDSQEEQSPGGTETTTTVTTITTVRESYSDPEPAVDRVETSSTSVTQEDSQRAETPELKKPFVYVKEYVNTSETSLHNANDGFGSDSDFVTSKYASSSYSAPRAEASSSCNYCGRLVGNDAKITIEHLNINCHPDCFVCGVCRRPMGDLLYSMFLHGGVVHCETCYSAALD